MAKVHVLEGDPRQVRAVVHYLTPSGSNSAGHTWVSVMAAVLARRIADAAKEGRTLTASILTEGTGVGQITTAEKNELTAGTTVEIELMVDIDGSGGSAAQVLPQLTAAINAHKAEMASKYKWYGRAEGTVN